MNNIYISIVSHGHEDMIVNNAELLKISMLEFVFVIIKDNLCSDKLKQFCQEKELHYIRSSNPMGFGCNNNHVFDYASNIGLDFEDWFLVINPDVNISINEFLKLKACLTVSKSSLLTVDLYSDKYLTVSDDSLRFYPGYSSLLNLVRGRPVTDSYNKQNLNNLSEVEWASGAFLIFQAGLYHNLSGFDKKYFMYYEDVDICFRANKLFNSKVTFLKGIKAYHKGAFANRRIFSKHFWWYISSLFKFLVGR
ncbi:glycosyltransferase family 2 protein [Shewanella sp. 5_MG-2023]|uniref:glycosyltransferase family 2 protein n=1 Tax=Shewanella sp. 5_MG-2023 TaxID=3062656 RepID=UPI0026E1D40F|nr:glycosyltransferase family 2 protein [Shewanella sp. 5_MG-2023]MDO6639184.1 glycosyltransferase family 2 protein [Shewanella sp. 5_MG-2023]